MSKALRINIASPRERVLLMQIAKGNLDFGELTQEEKYIVYTSDFKLEGYVNQEALAEYERKLGLWPNRDNEHRARLIVRSFTQKFRKRLTP